ncbi:MAG: hypothetical protein IJZ84_05690, partial [Lachnospiraceae bacterium]|nr:hypothetical protein [Lachnospiraceae bacterium]
IEQINAVKDEYRNMFDKGVYGADFEAKYAEFVAKLEKAGVNEVIADYQAQLDAWLAANGK